MRALAVIRPLVGVQHAGTAPRVLVLVLVWGYPGVETSGYPRGAEYPRGYPGGYPLGYFGSYPGATLEGGGEGEVPGGVIQGLLHGFPRGSPWEPPGYQMGLPPRGVTQSHYMFHPPLKHILKHIDLRG